MLAVNLWSLSSEAADGRHLNLFQIGLGTASRKFPPPNRPVIVKNAKESGWILPHRRL